MSQFTKRASISANNVSYDQSGTEITGSVTLSLVNTQDNSSTDISSNISYGTIYYKKKSDTTDNYLQGDILQGGSFSFNADGSDYEIYASVNESQSYTYSDKITVQYNPDYSITIDSVTYTEANNTPQFVVEFSTTKFLTNDNFTINYIYNDNFGENSDSFTTTDRTPKFNCIKDVFYEVYIVSYDYGYIYSNHVKAIAYSKNASTSINNFSIASSYEFQDTFDLSFDVSLSDYINYNFRDLITITIQDPLNNLVVDTIVLNTDSLNLVTFSTNKLSVGKTYNIYATVDQSQSDTKQPFTNKYTAFKTDGIVLSNESSPLEILISSDVPTNSISQTTATLNYTLSQIAVKDSSHPTLVSVTMQSTTSEIDVTTIYNSQDIYASSNKTFYLTGLIPGITNYIDIHAEYTYTYDNGDSITKTKTQTVSVTTLSVPIPILVKASIITGVYHSKINFEFLDSEFRTGDFEVYDASSDLKIGDNISVDSYNGLTGSVDIFDINTSSTYFIKFNKTSGTLGYVDINTLNNKTLSFNTLKIPTILIEGVPDYTSVNFKYVDSLGVDTANSFFSIKKVGDLNSDIIENITANNIYTKTNLYDGSDYTIDLISTINSVNKIITTTSFHTKKIYPNPQIITLRKLVTTNSITFGCLTHGPVKYPETTEVPYLFIKKIGALSYNRIDISNLLSTITNNTGDFDIKLSDNYINYSLPISNLNFAFEPNTTYKAYINVYSKNSNEVTFITKMSYDSVPDGLLDITLPDPTPYLKDVVSTYNNVKEVNRSVILNGEEIIYTKCNRSQLDEKYSNYFSSFNIPVVRDNLSSSSNFAKSFPELYQLNVDEIVLIPINNLFYDDYIDGRSISLNIPQINNKFINVISTTYSTFDKKQDNTLLGSNISFLFSDQINTPYSGSSSSGVNNSYKNSWNNSNSYLERFPATSYNDLSIIDIDTDKRDVLSVKYAVEDISPSYPSMSKPCYKYDIPVGFTALDKGYIIITHPDIIQNIPWASGTKCHLDSNGNIIVDGSNNNNTSYHNISFTANTYDTQVNPSASTLDFSSVSIEYVKSTICVAMPQEFYLSSNPTWDLGKNIDEAIVFNSKDLDPVYITQIGLYNQANELIAVAKLDRPIEKTYFDPLVFNVQISC